MDIECVRARERNIRIKNDIGSAHNLLNWKVGQINCTIFYSHLFYSDTFTQHSANKAIPYAKKKQQQQIHKLPKINIHTCKKPPFDHLLTNHFKCFHGRCIYIFFYPFSIQRRKISQEKGIKLDFGWYFHWML